MTEAGAWEKLSKSEGDFRTWSRIFFALAVICACGWPWLEHLRWFGIMAWALALQCATLASCTRQLKIKQAGIDMMRVALKGEK